MQDVVVPFVKEHADKTTLAERRNGAENLLVSRSNSRICRRYVPSRLDVRHHSRRCRVHRRLRVTGDVGLGAEAAAAVELETVAAVDVNRCVAVDGVPVVVVIQPRGEGARSPLLTSHCNETTSPSLLNVNAQWPLCLGQITYVS